MKQSCCVNPQIKESEGEDPGAVKVLYSQLCERLVARAANLHPVG